MLIFIVIVAGFGVLFIYLGVLLWNIKYALCSYSKINEMHQFLKFILFWISTLHVSDGLSVNHQKSKTVHTASSIPLMSNTHC